MFKTFSAPAAKLAVGETEPVTASRLHGLDALRAFCMLFGVMVHTTTVADFGLANSVPYVSSLFRMATFFAVSAFLSGVVLTRRSTKTYLRRRMSALGVPLLFGLFVLNPPTLWLVAKVHNPQLHFSLEEVLAQSISGQGRLEGPINWHLHLWFLFSLIIFSVLVSPILELLRTMTADTSRLARLAEVPPALRLPALAVLIGAICVLCRVAAGAVLSGPLDVWPLRATLLYLPFFGLGLILFCVPSLWARHAGNVRALPWLVGLALLAPSVQAGFGESLGGWIITILKPFSMASATILLLLLSAWLVRRGNRALEILADGIYTLYLSHFLLIYLVAWALMPMHLPLPLLFWTIALTVTAMGLGLHAVVKRQPVLSFLLNGVAIPRMPSAGAVPTCS